MIVDNNGYTATTANIRKVFDSGVFIPDFQRNFVWSNEKQRELIESIVKNHPIGAITLFEQYDKKGEYLIVDGLQRLTTIEIFLNNPNKIFKKKEYILLLGRKAINECYDHIGESQNDITFDSIEKIYFDWFTSLESKGDYAKFMHFIRKTSVGDLIKDEDLVEDIFKIFQKSIDIEQYELPMISYTGSRSVLQDMFAKLNSNGVVLSKYDVYHATWHNYSVSLDEEMSYVFRDEIESRKYLSQFEYENDNLEGIIKSVPLYYNFLVLNRKIANTDFFSDVVSITIDKTNDNKLKFGKQMKKQPFGFELYSTILNETPNTIDKVISNIFNKDDFSQDKTDEFFIKLNNCIIESTEIITKNVYDFFESLDNDYNKENNSLSKYHFYYLVCCNLYLNYRIDLDNMSIESYNDCINFTELYDKLFDVEKQIKESWFKNENRQISFFVSKIREFKLELESKSILSNDKINTDNSCLNIDSLGNFVNRKMFTPDIECIIEALKKNNCSNIQTVDYSNNRYYIEGNIFELMQLQDVNNEPYNKRVQGSRVKQCVEDNVNILGYYPIYDDNGIKCIFSLWRTKDLLTSNYNILEKKNPALKVNLIALRKMYSDGDFTNFDDYKYSSFIFNIKVAKEVLEKESIILKEFLSKSYFEIEQFEE